tara:strand:+ start:3805 stop:4566 length:762 start_codon:yes stop_codon:yes gene_type:complete
VCVDANAGARAQARAQAKKQDAIHRQRALSFWNREAQFKRNLDRSVIGLSRDQSDIYQNALYQAGQGRAAGQKAYVNYLRTKKVNEGGRARKFGKAGKKAFLAKKANVESVLTRIYGQQGALKQQQALRSFRSFRGKAREKMGLPAQPPPPVMMPPTNRLGGALSLIQSGLSIGASIATISASDIKMKENINKVGKSPQGYSIYEFNYIGDATRYRGVMAQDVVKIHPMAVEVMSSGYLGVNYDLIDVNMEEV